MVDHLVSYDVYAQPRLQLLWKLNDQLPFKLLVSKCGKAVLPAQDWPS